MRVQLGGNGLPIPTEGLPDGVLDETLPALLMELGTGIFDPTDYIGLGYTHFEVMCVGAAGGHGGKTTKYTGGGTFYSYLTFGGGGGGGGMHIVAGELADLDPSGVFVEVGFAGVDGAEGDLTANSAPVDQGQPGQDGGYSKFGDVAMASGGKGGGGTRLGLGPGSGGWLVSNRFDVPGGVGGEGGKGGTIVAGGGGDGGTADAAVSGSGVHESVIWTPIDPIQGSWDGTIGEGGGGGLGGTYAWFFDNRMVVV